MTITDLGWFGRRGYRNQWVGLTSEAGQATSVLDRGTPALVPLQLQGLDLHRASLLLAVMPLARLLQVTAQARTCHRPLHPRSPPLSTHTNTNTNTNTNTHLPK